MERGEEQKVIEKGIEEGGSGKGKKEGGCGKGKTEGSGNTKGLEKEIKASHRL